MELSVSLVEELDARLTRFEREFLSKNDVSATEVGKAFVRLTFHLNAIVKGETRTADPSTDWDALATEVVETYREGCFAISQALTIHPSKEAVSTREQGVGGAIPDEQSGLEHLVQQTIPFLVTAAKRFLPKTNDLLSRCRLAAGARGTVCLSRLECAEILAAGFLNCLPKDAWGEGGPWPRFDFNYILDCEREKCLCLLNYFTQIAAVAVGAKQQELQEEFVTFTRKGIPSGGEHSSAEECRPSPSMDELVAAVNRHIYHADSSSPESRELLIPVTVEPHARIDDCADCLQADFANEYLGGGVLHSGCVQEEIRFTVCPELLVGMLLCERMRDDEAIEIWGAEHFSYYVGYARNFRYAGPVVRGGVPLREVCLPSCTRMGAGDPVEESALSSRGGQTTTTLCCVRDVGVIAFDALCLPGEFQYTRNGIYRELIKAFVAFSGSFVTANGNKVATGNWGAGAFGGDPQLKMLIQWIAATVAGRPGMVYCSFDDERMDRLRAVTEKMVADKVTARQLLDGLVGGNFREFQADGGSFPRAFQFVLDGGLVGFDSAPKSKC